MKNYILIVFLIISSAAFSQVKKETLVKKWKLEKIEEFGQEYAPLENQQSDALEFTSDNKFIGTIEGLHIEGKWSISNKAILTVNKANSKLEVFWTKVKSVTQNKLVVEYQNGDLITSTLILIPAK